MVKLDIEIISSEYVIRDIDPDDSWDAGETGLEVHGVKVTRTDQDYGWKIDAEPGDSIVVLVEHYSDGCTFGSSQYAEVKGVFKTMQEAKDHASELDVDHGYFGWHIGFLYFEERVP